MKIEPLSQITVTADISRPVLHMTWADFGFTIGAKDPVLAEIKAALEKGDTYTMPIQTTSVLIAANGKVSKYHGDWSKSK